MPAQLPRRALSVSEADGARCIRALPGPASPFGAELPGPVTAPELLAYVEALPADVRRTLVAAGLEPLVARVMRERAHAQGAPSLELLALRQELDERLASLPAQMLALEFECECAIGLLVRALEEHDADVRDRQLALTVASLIAGAGFSLAAGAWDVANNHRESPPAPDGPLVTAIVGAVVTTALGAAAIAPRERAIAVAHAHNLLSPMSRGEDPERLYPTFVFRMLTLSTASSEPTPREQLLMRWGELLRAAASDHDREELEMLAFGQGGIYSADALRTRIELLRELETMLDSLARHVDELGRVLWVVLAQDGRR